LIALNWRKIAISLIMASAGHLSVIVLFTSTINLGMLYDPADMKIATGMEHGFKGGSGVEKCAG